MSANIQSRLLKLVMLALLTILCSLGVFLYSTLTGQENDLTSKTSNLIVAKSQGLNNSLRDMQGSVESPSEKFNAHLRDIQRDLPKLATDVTAVIAEHQKNHQNRLFNTLLMGLGLTFLVSSAIVFYLLGSTVSTPVRAIARSLNKLGKQIMAHSSSFEQDSKTACQGALTQAGAVEEISSALEQTESQSFNNAEHAGKAKALMQDTLIAVNEVRSAMENLMEEMSRVAEASNRSADIIQTIDEIAFQTNMLALNAAVEAARAGDFGLGFAVVAEEVRGLANRSVESSKKIQEIIQENINRVQTGYDLVEGATNVFERVDNQAQKAAALVTDIADASREQSIGIAQISKALVSVQQVVQQSTNLAQQSAVGSSELQQLSTTLLKSVHQLGQMVENQQERR